MPGRPDSSTPTRPPGLAAGRRRWPDLAHAGLALLLPLTVGLLYARSYLPFVADDALISLRYARRLLDGHGLTWTDGAAVEGYSNLLWILLAALLGAFGVDLIDAVRWLGYASTLLVLVALVALVRPRDASGVCAIWIGGLCIVASGPWAVWSVGGLESVGAAAALAWGVVGVARLLGPGTVDTKCALGWGIPFALLAWTRPDGPLLAGVLGASVVLSHRPLREGVRRAVLLGVPAVVAVLAQEAFRWVYYGDWIPNPAHIKASFGDHLVRGESYVLGGLEALAPVILLGVAGVVAAGAGVRRKTALACAAAALTWCYYVRGIGGDIFPAYRMMIPVVVSSGLAAALGSQRILSRWRLPLVGSMGVGAAVIALAVVWVRMQAAHPEMVRADDERWEWHGQVTGRALAEGFHWERPLLAVTAAGTLPYFSELPVLDMAGLNDRHIARTPRRAGGKLGHDHADAAYVLDREPDLLVFGSAYGNFIDELLPGRQMKRERRFHRDYRVVHFRGLVPYVGSTLAYTRVRGRLGVQYGNDRVWTPGWHLGSDLVAQPGPDGRMAARIPTDRKLESVPIELSRGWWRVHAQPSSPRIDLALVSEGPPLISAGSGDRVLLRVERSARVRVATRARGVEVLLRGVAIEREAPPSEAVPRSAARVVEVCRARSLPDQRQLIASFDEIPADWRVAGTAASGRDAREGSTPSGVRGAAIDTRDVHGKATGSAIGPRFLVPPGAILAARIAGSGRTSLRVAVEGRVVDAHPGLNASEVREIRTDLIPWAGRWAHLELVDDDATPGAFIVLDEVALLIGDDSRYE